MAVDGTFAVCPSLFYQLYTMHGIIKDTTVPLVYCLMSKTKEKYKELFAALKNLNAMLDPHEVTMDFEIAAIEALKSSFPIGNLKGCFFHLAQANWRKIQSVGLVREYQQDTNVRILLKSFVALASIPEENIYLRFQKLKETTAKMQNEKNADFVSYFEATWLGKNCEGDELGPPSCHNFGANLKTPKKCAKKPIMQLKGGTSWQPPRVRLRTLT